MNDQAIPVGEMLRDWRQRRRYSQLALALEVEISQRHLSFLESGRSRPSRDMVLRLAEYLQVPLREQNAMLLAAGLAPAYREHALASPDMAQARAVIEQILQGHEPHPALAVDRGWTIRSANRAVSVLTEGVAPSLLEGEVNALRLSLHPDGLAPRIVNFAEWRAHILSRLVHDIDLSADPRLVTLLDELKSYPTPSHTTSPARVGAARPAIAVPLVIDSREGQLAFLSTTTLFGTAVDITLADIVIESFFPADARTAEAMTRLMREIVGDRE
jgi:transcriptional regulator with XRE-family HTH domain